MAKISQVANVLVAGPSDAREAREIVQLALYTWNDHRSEDTGYFMQPKLWEMASVPVTGRGDAQSVINMQLVDNADIVIAVFNFRLGAPTQRAVSGTAEEIQRCLDADKLVHLFFSRQDLPRDVDVRQLTRLQLFERKMTKLGLVGYYNDPKELANEVPKVLELDVASLRDRQANAASQ